MLLCERRCANGPTCYLPDCPRIHPIYTPDIGIRCQYKKVLNDNWKKLCGYKNPYPKTPYWCYDNHLCNLPDCVQDHILNLKGRLRFINYCKKTYPDLPIPVCLEEDMKYLAICE